MTTFDEPYNSSTSYTPPTALERGTVGGTMLPPAREFPSSAPDQVIYLLSELRDALTTGRGDGKASEIAHRLDLILQVGAGLMVTTEKVLTPADRIGTDAVSGKPIYATPVGTIVLGHHGDGTPIHGHPSDAEVIGRGPYGLEAFSSPQAGAVVGRNADGSLHYGPDVRLIVGRNPDSSPIYGDARTNPDAQVATGRNADGTLAYAPDARAVVGRNADGTPIFADPANRFVTGHNADGTPIYAADNPPYSNDPHYPRYPQDAGAFVPELGSTRAVVGRNPDGTPIYSSPDTRGVIGRNPDGTPIYAANDPRSPQDVPFVPAPAPTREVTGHNLDGSPIYKTL